MLVVNQLADFAVSPFYILLWKKKVRGKKLRNLGDEFLPIILKLNGIIFCFCRERTIYPPYIRKLLDWNSFFANFESWELNLIPGEKEILKFSKILLKIQNKLSHNGYWRYLRIFKINKIKHLSKKFHKSVKFLLTKVSSLTLIGKVLTSNG